MECKLKYVVFPEDGVFVARCLEVEVTSDGPTEEKAVTSLQEALELYFEGNEIKPSDLPRRAYRFGEMAVRT